MIHYSKVITPASVDPVWLSEAKAHLKIDGTDEDDLIAKKIMAATAMCEKYAGLSFVTQTRRVTLDKFCSDDVILPYGPVQSITSFVYVDTDDVSQTVNSADYTLDLQSALSKVRVLETWPYTNETLNNVVITYVAGTATQDVPYEAKEAVLRLTARLYEKRGDTNEGLMTEDITDLLDLIKVYWYAG